jgi:hypothetical protein
MNNQENKNRNERRQARKEGHLDNHAFLKVADRFIDVANDENQNVLATELQMAFLYAAARYNAHVAKNVLNVEDQEDFVKEMSKHYQEMLRNHLADPQV